MKKILLSIKRNRTFKAIKANLQKERSEEAKNKNNLFDEMKDLSQYERKSVRYWKYLFLEKESTIRSSFNVDLWRKVKRSRLKTQ